MHSRVIRPRTDGARRALPWLLILLAHPVPDATAAPYLRHVPPPPLRSLEPVVIGVDSPVATPAAAVSAPLQEMETMATVEATPAKAIPETQPDTAAPLAQDPVSAPPAPPLPILRDPLRERVNLEDFLPFFTPPAPQIQPASSATYRRE